MKQFNVDISEDEHKRDTAVRSHTTMDLREMVEALIRLGIDKYGEMSQRTERVRRLLDIDILPHANRMKLDEFRAAMRKPRMLKTWKANEISLKAVFNHYAARHADNARYADKSSLPEAEKVRML
jgi:7,8-dihydro-6-hydroxymethylpterin-pyrophosphokinase